MRPKIFKRRQKSKEKKMDEKTIIDAESLTRIHDEMMQKINALFDDVYIENNYFEEEFENGNNGISD